MKPNFTDFAQLSLLLTVIIFATHLDVRSVSAFQDNELTEEGIFDPENLLEVEIQLAEEDWLELCAQTRNFASALSKEMPQSPFTYFEGDITINGVHFPSVGIRKKGFIGSLDDFRPSLKISFDEYEERGPVAGLTRLTLNNDKQDPSHLSAYLTYKFFREAGVPAPRCNWARVTVNGQYLGVYSHVESIRKPFLQRNFGDDSGDLYEGTVADLYVDRLERIEVKTNRNSNDRSDLVRLAEIFSNDESQLESMQDAIEYEKFLKFWAVECMAGFWDGYSSNQNNYYFYQDPETSRYTFIPWGADSSFSDPPSILYKPGPESVRTAGLITYRLYQHEAVQQEYRQTLLDLFDSIWVEESLLDEIDRAESLLADHVSAEQAGFEEGVENVRDFISNRREELMEEIAEGPAVATYQARRPIYMVAAGKMQGSFDTVWHENNFGDAFAGQAEIELELDGEIVEFSRLGSKAEPAMQFGPSPEGVEQPPTVVLTGIRDSDQVRVTIALSIARQFFAPSEGQSIQIDGVIIEGFNFQGMKFISGSAVIKAASEVAGEPVIGSFEGEIVTIKLSE